MDAQAVWVPCTVLQPLASPEGTLRNIKAGLQLQLEMARQRRQGAPHKLVILERRCRKHPLTHRAVRADTRAAARHKGTSSVTVGSSGLPPMLIPAKLCPADANNSPQIPRLEQGLNVLQLLLPALLKNEEAAVQTRWLKRDSAALIPVLLNTTKMGRSQQGPCQDGGLNSCPGSKGCPGWATEGPVDSGEHVPWPLSSSAPAHGTGRAWAQHAALLYFSFF